MRHFPTLMKWIETRVFGLRRVETEIAGSTTSAAVSLETTDTQRVTGMLEDKTKRARRIYFTEVTTYHDHAQFAKAS